MDLFSQDKMKSINCSIKSLKIIIIFIYFKNNYKLVLPLKTTYEKYREIN